MPYLYQFAPRPVAGRVPGIIRALRRAVLLGALLALGGCSALRLSYNSAPELLHWWLDGFADFDKAQSQRVRTDLAELARWHRREELPLVAELLQSAQALASQSPARSVRTRWLWALSKSAKPSSHQCKSSGAEL